MFSTAQTMKTECSFNLTFIHNKALRERRHVPPAEELRAYPSLCLGWHFYVWVCLGPCWIFLLVWPLCLLALHKASTRWTLSLSSHEGATVGTCSPLSWSSTVAALLPSFLLKPELSEEEASGNVGPFVSMASGIFVDRLWTGGAEPLPFRVLEGEGLTFKFILK